MLDVFVSMSSRKTENEINILKCHMASYVARYNFKLGFYQMENFQSKKKFVVKTLSMEDISKFV